MAFAQNIVNKIVARDAIIENSTNRLRALIVDSPGWKVKNQFITLGKLELGKKIYLKHGKVCHGIKGDGNSFAANGRPQTAMMPWKDNLTAEKIRATVHYIRKELMGVAR